MECDSIFFLILFVASTVVCQDPTPPSGVTVVQPHSTTISSVIVYQCQQSGFTPSPPSSVCGEDGTWSPDPTQVVCVMVIPTTTVTTGEMLVLTGNMEFTDVVQLIRGVTNQACLIK